MIGVGIGIPFFRSFGGGIDAQAQAHYNRVIADGGVVPSGLSGVNAFFSAVKAIYGTSDINTAISAAYDPHYLGYRLGAGSGTTLGQAARTLYAPKGIFGGIGTGSAYWEGVNVGQNNVVTPDAPANRITGDVDIICYLLHTSNGGFNSIVSKNDGGTNRAYNLTVQTNTPTFYYGAATLNTATATANITSGSSLWLRVTRNATNGEIKFFTSNDASTTNPQSVTWTQLGATVSGVTGALNSSGTLPLIIGGYISTGSGFASTERIFRVTIANSIGGTPVVDFNANQYTGANTWTSTTGEVWTVNSTGAGLADVTQTTAASQPLLLAHTGENYWWGSGQPGNFVQTPFASKLNITGDISFTAKVKLTIAPTDGDFIFASSSGSNRYYTGINAARKIFLWINGGSVTWTSVTSLSANYDGWIRASRSVSTGDCSFFTSADGVNWTLLETVAGSTAAITTNSLPLNIGHWGTSQAGWRNYLYRATLYDNTTCTGTPVVDFNPSSYNPSTSQTQWTSATGEVWSINVGTATTGYKGAVITKSIVQGDGVDDRLASGTLTSVSTFTRYVAANPLQRAGFGVLVSGGNSLNTAFYKDSSAIRIYNTGTGVGALSFTSPSSHILALFTADYNTTSSKAAINNGTDATGTIGDNPSNSMNVFADNGNNGNGIVNTIISCSTVNTPSQKTAIYNAIRGFNNNAF